MCINNETTFSLMLVGRIYGMNKLCNTREFRQAMIAHATGPCARQYVAISKKVLPGNTQIHKTSYISLR
jgi:hypothetical protein